MFIIEVPYINLDQIYESGQVFRWIKLKEHKYIVPFRNKALKIEQNKNKLIFGCTESEFYDIWYWYFDLCTDYLKLNYKTKTINDYLKVCANRGSGIHILKQDLFEMIITFILAQSSSIKTTKLLLNELCITCGIKHTQSMSEAGKRTWYEFPSPQMILANQDELNFVDKETKQNIVQICQDIVDGWFVLNELEYMMSYKEAKDYLLQFESIKSKAADYICLYALKMYESFPVNRIVAKVLKREFDCDDEIFREWYLADNGNLAGLIQQYITFNELNPPKEVILNGTH